MERLAIAAGIGCRSHGESVGRPPARAVVGDDVDGARNTGQVGAGECQHSVKIIGHKRGARDDHIGQWPAGAVGRRVQDVSQHVKTSQQLAADRVAEIQRPLWAGGDEELRAVRVLPGICHRQLAVAAENGVRVELVIIMENRPAGAVRAGVAALDDETRNHAVKDRVARIKPAHRETLDRVHRARCDIAEQHECHVPHICDGRDPAAKRGLKRAWRIRRRRLHHGHFPERIVGVHLYGDAVRAACGRKGQRLTVWRTGGDGNDE